MDVQDIRTLKLLEEIDKDIVYSQRDLAHKMNVSLGLVNSFIKRLAHKGYFKIKTIPRKRIKYILTPKGVAEKSRLTYEYIQHSFYFYKDARQKLYRLFAELEHHGVRRIVFYGATPLAEIAFISVQDVTLKVVCVVDDLKADQIFLRMKIRKVETLKSLSFDRILITTMDSIDDVYAKLSKAGIHQNRIVIM
ncbi:winged helix-turn-helix transcriptional regulator [Desulfococcaceae bacterium HSG9]|nr:winged helix-turn-helix transcriptional regulator [Desulfococcaceae bacterium HSG9]